MSQLMSQKDRIIKIKDITDKISPTFCLAKWHHTTIYLQTGETHSCYHPAPHKIPLEEIAINPSALHNTMEKKLQRKEMLKGNKPSGCQYCWNIEAMGPDYISDRHDRNSGIYTEERLTEIESNEWDFNINPEYIEISFGNECNFKCGYCHPKHSSSYYKEIEKFGPYSMVKNHRNDIDWFTIQKNEDENPYVKAWWDWWPTMKHSLNILRITGGEPLLQSSTWRLLEDLDQNPLPNLELNINSNLGVKPILVERLAEKVEKLRLEGKIKGFKLFTSLDTWGTRAEYIRTGLDLTVWEQNFHTYLTKTKNPITFMITFNILSVSSFKTLLIKLLEWRSQYGWYDHLSKHRIRFDTPHLKEPLQYDMNILPKSEFMPYMKDSLKFISDNIDNSASDKFSDIEYEKFRRVVDYMESTTYSDDKLLIGRRDFYNWFNEYDRRRDTNFSGTFPEMEQFFTQCKQLNVR
jgi:hypothetical protein